MREIEINKEKHEMLLKKRTESKCRDLKNSIM